MNKSFIRFFKKVKKTDTCWIWLGAKSNGYGVFRANKIKYLAHRFIYQITNNYSFSKFDLVCHSCDNPSCVNPDHLFIGTQKDNVRDCIKKGRFKNIGETNCNAKLKDVDVLSIKKLIKTGFKDKYISDLFSVKHQTINSIRHKKTWNHISEREYE